MSKHFFMWFKLSPPFPLATLSPVGFGKSYDLFRINASRTTDVFLQKARTW